MKKTAFLTLDQAKTIAARIPTPFHIYDEAGIRRNARALKAAFSWNKGFREYFAVKATPNPYLLRLRLLQLYRTAPCRGGGLHRKGHHVLLQCDPGAGYAQGL